MQTEKNMVIELLKLNDNKKILWVDSTLKLTIKTIIDNTLRSYKGLPLSWEDIYYEFLYSTPKLINDFDLKQNISLKTWIGVRCRFFTLNKCRELTKGSNKVMNNYVSFSRNETIENRLRDSEVVDLELDISTLTKAEFEIYDEYFIGLLSIPEIVKKVGISRYKVEKMIDSIKRKLVDQVKK